jgi:CRISPR/Cas system-associated exonuclease Cas4 (RecB family)
MFDRSGSLGTDTMANKHDFETRKAEGAEHPYPKEFVQTGRPYISPSQIIRILRCPQSYYAYYFLDKSEPPNLKLKQGDILHDTTAEAITERDIFTTTIEDAIAGFRALLRQHCWQWVHEDQNHRDIDDAEHLDDESEYDEWEDQLVDAGEEVVKAFYNLDIHQCIVEEPLKTPFDPNVDLFGQTDLIGESTDLGRIALDWKSTGRKPGSPKKNHLYQVTTYAIMAEHKSGQAIDHVVIPYIVLRKSGSVDARVFTFELTQQRKDWAWMRTQHAIATLRRCFKTGDWPAQPITADWYCGYCPHRDECPAAPRIWDNGDA